MRSLVLLAATALSSCVLVAGAQAQTTGNGGEVVVTARTLEDTLPEQLARSGVKVDVVQGAQIRQGGYPDLSGALQALAPGLFILPKNGPFDYVDLSLMGSRTSDVLWLVDGVRVNNRLYAGTTPLDTLPSGMVDRVEVLEGGQALFYGTQAVAGAVNVVTKPYSNVLTGSVLLSADSNSGRHADGNVAGAFGPGQYVAFGSADKSEGYKAFRDQDYQPSSTHRKRGYQVYTVGGKYAWDATSQLRLEGAYTRTWADVDFAQPYRVAKNLNSRIEDLGTVKIDYQPTERLSVFVKAYWHNWHTTYDTVYNDLAPPHGQIVLYDKAFWGFWDYGVNALAKLDVTQGVQAYFGYDMQSYGGRDDVLVIKQTDERTHAVFGQLRLTPDLVPGLNLAGGFRYNSPSVGEAATIWNFSGRYQMPGGVYLKGEVGTNFRLPTAEELFADDPADERGNPKLKPERSISANLSLGGRLEMVGHGLHWEITGFARDVQDLIDLDTFDTVTNQDVFGNVAGIVRTRGMQALVDANFTDSLSGNLNYTYNHTVDDSGDQLARIPLALFKGGLDYHPKDQPWGATADLVYTGDAFRTVAGTDVSYGGYVVVDLSARYFLDRDRRQTVNFSIRNLFDKTYGLPNKGCRDTAADGPFDCSIPYTYVNLGLPRTFAASYRYAF